MKILALHLSDIHISADDNPVLKRSQEIAACTYAALPTADALFVVVSGDVAYSGKAKQYELATSLLGAVAQSIRKERDLPLYFVLAPGNHDCDFDLDNASRRNFLALLGKTAAPEIDESVIDACTRVQRSFFEFRNKMEDTISVTDDLLWRQSVFKVGDETVTFDSLNLAWCSQKREMAAALYFPVSRYEGSAASRSSTLTIALVHHPFNWLGQHSYRHFRAFLRTRSDLIVTGHEHQGNVGTLTEAESGSSAFVEGCALWGESGESAFHVIQIDSDARQFCSTRYRWTVGRYEPVEDGSWTSYHDLPITRRAEFMLTNAFESELEDPGAFFTAQGRDVRLSEVYVYPDLAKPGEEGKTRKQFTSSSVLLRLDLLGSGAVIEGDVRSGRTSLLRQLYRAYHERGIVPLLIDGDSLRRAEGEAVDKVILRAVERQYGSDAVERYKQLGQERKLLLVDNFEESPIRSAAKQTELLKQLQSRSFSLVAAVGPMFEVRELLDGGSTPGLKKLSHYKIQPFGHVLRSELAERWFAMSCDGMEDDGEQLARHDRAERLMDAVMKRSVIPAVPFYLLTLLQSLELTNAGEFADSAQGHYYHYLLTKAFREAGIRNDKLTEVFQYCTQLAWFFHGLNKKEISEAEFREFNLGFNAQWHTVDFVARKEELVRSRVLSLAGADYCFRYPYAYYYFKSLYLSDNMSDLDTRAYIEHCCSHLYVRDHAYTLLFLAHHTNDEFVLRSISNALRSLFSARAPVTFSTQDSSVVAKLVEHAPKLTYHHKSPKYHRNEQRSINDALGSEKEVLAEEEEPESRLSLLAELTALSKTTEILGQILRNQYSRIARPQKVELLRELFDGPLRALADFYDFLGKNPEVISAEVGAALHDRPDADQKEVRANVAKQVAGTVVEMITVSQLWSACDSVSADVLVDDVRAAVRGRESIAYSLIEIGVLLDSPQRLPRARLREVAKEVAGNMVATRLLHIMVLRRLYMFKTTEQDMQWLQGELKLDIFIQRQIAMRSHGARLLK